MSMDHTSDDSPVERYLDDLMRRLPGDARAVRRALAETEAHLYDAVEAHQASGLSRREAERAAVADFGPAPTIARGFVRIALRDLARPTALFVAVGLLAIGVSGLLSELMGRVWGARFIAGDVPGTTYTPGRCADFMSYFPGRGCLDAAALDHFDEVVLYRGAAGVLGLVVLLAWWLLPRRGALPSGLVTAVGAGVFGCAAAATAAMALDTATRGGGGAGQWLSAAVVATAVAAAYALRLSHVLHPFRPARMATHE